MLSLMLSFHPHLDVLLYIILPPSPYDLKHIYLFFRLTHVVQNKWPGDKPKKELTNYFPANDFVKINVNAHQMTVQEA